MIVRTAVLAVALSLVACKSSDSASGPREPAGTPSDPVTECKRVADVCRLDGSRLGVCTMASPDTAPEACAGRTPCILCMSQH